MVPSRSKYKTTLQEYALNPGHTGFLQEKSHDPNEIRKPSAN